MLVCRNSPIICNWCTLGLRLKYLLRNTLNYLLIMLETRCIKSFLYSKSIIWLKLSTLTCQTSVGSDFFLVDIHTWCHWIYFSGPFIRKVWLLAKFLITFKVAFYQVFLTSAGNPVTSAKLIGSVIKCDNSEPDYRLKGCI